MPMFMPSTGFAGTGLLAEAVEMVWLDSWVGPGLLAVHATHEVTEDLLTIIQSGHSQLSAGVLLSIGSCPNTNGFGELWETGPGPELSASQHIPGAEADKGLREG